MSPTEGTPTWIPPSEVYNRELSLSVVGGVCVGGSLFCLVKPFWFQQHCLWFSLHSGFLLAPCIQSQSPPCKAFTCWELAFLTENNLHQIRLLLYSKQLDVAHPYLREHSLLAFSVTLGTSCICLIQYCSHLSLGATEHLNGGQWNWVTENFFPCIYF